MEGTREVFGVVGFHLGSGVFYTGGGNWGPRFELFETGVSILLSFSTVNNESGVFEDRQGVVYLY